MLLIHQLNVRILLDATPFLFVSFEMKKEDSLKPYDTKKSVWVPNKEEGGYDEGLIQEINGEKATVKVGWEMKDFKASELQQVNPPKMEKCEDVTNMTYLNDASCLLYTSPSPRDRQKSRMPSSA